MLNLPTKSCYVDIVLDLRITWYHGRVPNNTWKAKSKITSILETKKKPMQLKVTCHKNFFNVFVSDLLIELNKYF